VLASNPEGNKMVSCRAINKSLKHPLEKEEKGWNKETVHIALQTLQVQNEGYLSLVKARYPILQSLVQICCAANEP
jgi:hypothetical protein